MKIEALKNIILFIERDARPQGVVESYALVEAHMALKAMFEAMQSPPSEPSTVKE